MQTFANFTKRQVIALVALLAGLYALPFIG
jgi:hypothetical protein